MSATTRRMTVAIVLSVGIAMLLSSNAQAQRIRMSVEEQVKVLKDSLKLNEDQATKITKVLEDLREEMTTTMNEQRGDRESMRTMMQEIRKKTDDQIKAVLTEKQVKKYEDMLKARRDRMDRRLRRSSKP